MAGTHTITLAVLAGDGIGPEITVAAVTVLKAAAQHAGLSLRLQSGLMGWKAYEKYASTLPEATLKTLRQCEGWIVGPTFAGEYPADDPLPGYPNGFIRRHF
jgi:3-isopropylmalate dehydrogenase